MRVVCGISSLLLYRWMDLIIIETATTAAASFQQSNSNTVDNWPPIDVGYIVGGSRDAIEEVDAHITGPTVSQTT
jgi:hypothetical protein